MNRPGNREVCITDRPCGKRLRLGVETYRRIPSVAVIGAMVKNGIRLHAQSSPWLIQRHCHFRIPQGP